MPYSIFCYRESNGKRSRDCSNVGGVNYTYLRSHVDDERLEPRHGRHPDGRGVRGVHSGLDHLYRDGGG